MYNLKVGYYATMQYEFQRSHAVDLDSLLLYKTPVDKDIDLEVYLNRIK